MINEYEIPGCFFFSSYSNAASGAIFVFGKSYQDHFYAFKVCLLFNKTCQLILFSY